MIDFIKNHNKKVFFVLVALTTVGVMSNGVTRRTNRVAFVRGGQKVYTLIRPYNINKTTEEMQSEANAGRSHFATLFQGSGPATEKDILQFVTPVKDQGHRGTCVAFASTALVEAELRKAHGGMPNYSEQFIYWASKAMEKYDPNADGSEPIYMLKTYQAEGTPVQQEWPYDPNPWFADTANHKDCVNAYKANPDNVPTECVTDGDPTAQAKAATKVKVAGLQNIPTSPEAIVGEINNGVPVEIGIDVYQNAWSFNQPKSANFLAGIVTMPTSGDKVIGGHAVLIVGYDTQNQVYLFKNSWGTDEWGSRAKYKGFGTIPMDYVRKFGTATIAPQVN